MTGERTVEYSVVDGLGLVYVADIVLAAEGTRFLTGFGGLGLSGDGGGTWFLPHLVGMRRRPSCTSPSAS